ncbi:MAG: SDR family NAD(P)-dependent oxidoreductase [Candidatus Dormibacteraeota bacterium]|nr:SDR family NAD(P)-dependent oxidoreductase [Candidatus Dormibacteraeota bacterium]
MRVFITGATGFIGSEVARRLRERGDEVTALVRDPSKAASVTELGCETVRGDLADEEAIRKGMDGCDVVVHGAAIYEVGIPSSRRPQMYEANVVGTERILRLAADAGVGKIVYVSTVNAFGNTEGQVVDESHVHTERYVSYYDETKHLAHKAAKAAIERGLPVVIVQPGAVYGPGDKSPQGNLINQFLAGKLPAKTFPEAGLNMVHRDDVAAGILLCIDRGKTGEQYVLGGELTTIGGLIDTVAKVAGKKSPSLVVPAVVMKAISPLGPVIGPALGMGPNLAEIIKATHNVTYWAKDDKARTQLGYASRGLEQGLRDTLLAEGRLPARASAEA